MRVEQCTWARSSTGARTAPHRLVGPAGGRLDAVQRNVSFQRRSAANTATGSSDARPGSRAKAAAATVASAPRRNGLVARSRAIVDGVVVAGRSWARAAIADELGSTAAAKPQVGGGVLVAEEHPGRVGQGRQAA
jgi:hypothetical protein